MVPRSSTIDAGVDLAVVDPALLTLAREVRLLGAVTPLDAGDERARLIAAFERGYEREPRWQYAPVDRTVVRRKIDQLARELQALPDTALVRLYEGRVRELGAEAAMVDAIGTPRFGTLAQTRFAGTTMGASRSASLLASTWLALETDAPASTLPSDSDDARSLLSRMRAEVTRLGLAFDVVPSDSLAALAAIGEGRIWVTTGRAVTRADVERTVMHELYGHALPRSRAAELALGLFASGTARGSDHQEGLALVLEERGGFLLPRRQRELAGRHTVIERMAGGATFVEAVRGLMGVGFRAAEAVRMAERAYRGGDGRTPGLGRERVYLESYVAVRERLENAPGDLAVLSSGQVALDAVETLRPFA